MKKIILLLVILILSLAYTVNALPSGAETTEGAVFESVASESENLTTVAGNLTEINLTTLAASGRWAGLFGTVNGGIELNDGGTNAFYSWLVTDFGTAAVYAVNSSTSVSWDDLIAANSTLMPSYLVTVATDNFTNTFNESEDFNTTTFNVSTVPYIETLQYTGSGEFKTYSLTDGTSLIWSGLVTDDAIGFDNSVIDYQIMLPASSTPTTYNLYLDLS